MCATVATFKTKHTVGGRKISFGRPDMHTPVIETNLHNITMDYYVPKAASIFI